MEGTSGWLKEHIRDVPDFPKPGVVFKDITPLLANAAALAECVGSLAGAFAGRPVDKVIGVEARGFIVAAPIAVRLGAGFVPVRKAGKLPWRAREQAYQLEYGTGTLEMHDDALSEGEQVLVVDDVLATGGTAAATVRLVEAAAAVPVGFGCVIELGFLGGRRALGDLEVVSLIGYQ